MKTVASTSAIQMPNTSSGGNTSGSVRQGKGMCHRASTVIAATARIESAITGRRDRIVAATVTGARIRVRERVLQTAGQVQQDGELQDVVAEAQRGVSFAEAGRG